MNSKSKNSELKKVFKYVQLGLKKYDTKINCYGKIYQMNTFFFSILIAIDFFFIIFFLVVPLHAGRYNIQYMYTLPLISAEVRYTKCTCRLEIMVFNYCNCLWKIPVPPVIPVNFILTFI